MRGNIITWQHYGTFVHGLIIIIMINMKQQCVTMKFLTFLRGDHQDDNGNGGNPQYRK